MAGFRDIYCDICLDQVEFVIACSDKSSKFNSFACTLVVSDGVLACLQWYKLFIDESKAIYFASFYFRVFNSICEIRENKNLAKIYSIQW